MCKIFKILLLAHITVSCQESEPSRHFYIPSLQKSYDILEEVTNDRYQHLRRVNADNPDNIKQYFEEGRTLFNQEKKLQELIASLMDSTLENQISFNKQVKRVNNQLKRIYSLTDYAYGDCILYPKTIELPIDSAEYWLMKIESKRNLNHGIRAFLTMISVAPYESFFEHDLYVFAPGQDTIRVGEDYTAQLTLGNLDKSGQSRQELSSIEVWINGTVLKNANVDTSTVWGSLREMKIKPEVEGIYRWKANYRFLRPNGRWDTISKENIFLVN